MSSSYTFKYLQHFRYKVKDIPYNISKNKKKIILQLDLSLAESILSDTTLP